MIPFFSLQSEMSFIKLFLVRNTSEKKFQEFLESSASDPGKSFLR
jgi:hypothetical protein